MPRQPATISRARAKTPAKKSKGPSKKPAIDSPKAIPMMKKLAFIGWVNPWNPGSGTVEGSRHWTFAAYLKVWKVVGGPVVQEQLVVTATKIGDQKLATLRKQFAQGKLVRFTAKQLKRRFCGSIAVELVRFLGKVHDKELSPIVRELSRRIEIRDRMFGTIKYNKEYEYFEGVVSHAGKELSLTFDTQSIEEAKTMIELAKPLWRSRVKWFKEFQALATRKLFDQCNGWRSFGDEPPLTKQEFLQLLGNPCGLAFQLEDGELEFQMFGWSDELLGDSGMTAEGSLKKGLTDACAD